MIRHTRFPTACVLAAVFLTPQLPAQERPADEDKPRTTVREEIVVSATRREATRSEVGSSVTVITAEEIALRRQTTVAEILRTVPGLEVVRGGGAGQVTSVFIRGGSSSHTLVLVDGMRANSATTGAYDFADLAADNVERIEIVRGPQSTLYGSEAVAGVISIFTKRGRDGVNVSGLAEAGELGERRLRAALDGTAGGFDYALSVSDRATDGVSVARRRAGNPERDPYDNTTATAGLGTAFAGDGRIDLDLRVFEGEAGNDGFDFLLGPVDDLNRVQRRDAWIGSLRVRKPLGERGEQSFRVGVNDDRLTGSDPDNAFSNFTIDSRTLELLSQTDLFLAPDDVLTLGLVYEEREGGSVGSFDERVDVRSAFVQNAWSRGGFHLTAGARYDDHSQFGDETTWRLAASWSAADATRLHASWGTGFKAPTLNDLFFPFFSNPDLRPETSEAVDLGVEHGFGDGRFVIDLTVFRVDFEDLIAFSFVTFVPENIVAAESEGIEASVRYRPGPGLELFASHTWNETEDLATGLALARRPEHRTTLAVSFRPTEKLRGSVTAIAVADRIDSNAAPLDDYERVDLALGYRVADELEPYLRVENLFDEDYEELAGFTTPGRVAVVGLRFAY